MFARCRAVRQPTRSSQPPWVLGRARCMAAAAAAHQAVDRSPCRRRNVAELHAVRASVLPALVLRAARNTKSASRPASIRPQLSLRMRAVLRWRSRRPARGNVAEARSSETMAGCRAAARRAGGSSVAEDHAVRALKSASRPARGNRDLLVALCTISIARALFSHSVQTSRSGSAGGRR